MVTVELAEELQGLGRYIRALLSLVQLLHYCALIGRELHIDEILKNMKGPTRGGFHARNESIIGALMQSLDLSHCLGVLAGHVVVDPQPPPWEQSPGGLCQWLEQSQEPLHGVGGLPLVQVPVGQDIVRLYSTV